jgi:hypothetical protein
VVRSDWRNYLDTSNLHTPTPPGLPTFTEVAGDWSVVAGQLRLSTSDGLLISDTDPTTPLVTLAVQCAGSHGDTIRLVGGYKDPDNYLCAELQFSTLPSGSGALRLLKKEAGNFTTLSAVTIPGNWFWFDPWVWLRLCFRSDRSVWAGVEINFPQVGATIEEPRTESVTAQLPTLPIGTRWGYGTGAVTVAARSLREFSCRRQTGDCLSCYACTFCSNVQATPHDYLVTLSGISAATQCGATNCGSLDGMYVLRRAGDYGSPYWSQRGVCIWRMPLNVPLGGTCGAAKSIVLARGNIPFTTNHPIYGTALIVSTSATGVGQTFNQVHLRGDVLAFAKIVAGQPGQGGDPLLDCSALSESLPAYSLFGAGRACGTATCTITPLV